MRSYAPSIRWDPQVQAHFEHAFGIKRLQEMSERLCVPSLKPTLRVNNLRVSTEEALRQLQQALPPGSQQPYAHHLVPLTLVVPGTGPATGLDYAACGAKEVLVNRLAGESVLKGADIFAPGVLGCSKGVVPGDLLAVSIAMPDSDASSCTRGSGSGPGRPGRRAEAAFVLNRGCTISEANQHLLPQREHLYIGLGRAQLSRRGIFRARTGLAVSMEQRVFDVPPINGLLRGQVMLQALPSIVAALALAPQPGSRVLDMCSAPGGKTTALAQLMGDSGELVALDRTEAKVAQVRSLAADLGITCITALKLDATRCLVRQQQEDAASAAAAAAQQQEQQLQQQQRLAAGSASGSADGSSSFEDEDEEGAGPLSSPSSYPQAQHQHRHEQQQEAAQRYSGGLQPGSFDYVLLDPPCSALGLRPRLLHDITLHQLRKVASYQRAMIHNAVELLRPGGTLLYCTCTINPGENEANVNYITSRYPGMRLARQPLHIAQPGLTAHSGSSGGAAETQELWLPPAQAELVQRFCPADEQLDCMGFFVARFVKEA